MNKNSLLALILMTSSTLHAATSEQFVAKKKLPTGQTVVVAEGKFEARSLGSFSVRLYDAAPSEDATTFFSTGQIRARDGSIEKVVITDVSGDKQPEVVVIVRSAGSGGYLSAHAFSVDKQTLKFCTEVNNLEAKADPIAALRKHHKDFHSAN